MLKIVDPDLIVRAQRGETKVITSLYERFHPDIFRYLYYKVGDIQTAEDLTSEVFLRMLQALPGYRMQKVPFQAWLFQIARNLVIDHYRSMNRRNHIQLDENITAGGDNLAATVERGLNGENLRRALTHLSDDQRDVILMRFVSGMPIAQVAQALHKSEDAVKGLQRRALVALRQILADWEVAYD
jgi:RNA polymerase sigma-70 factor (ECF subfamily)